MPATSAKPLRLLLIAPSARFVGGHSVQAEFLRRGLEGEPAIRVTFLPIDSGFGPFELLRRLPGVRTALSILLFVARLIRNVPRHDVVHVFAAAYLGFYWWPAPAILLCKLLRTPCLLNYHDGQCEDHLRRWPLAARLARMADKVITPSGFLVDVFAKFGIPAAVAFNVVEPEALRYRERARPRPAFLQNRALEPLYNVACTLRAFALVQRRYPEASLTVAHDGPQRGELERLAAELGLRNTAFVGKLPHAQAVELYDAADIYLTSPNTDNMPVSLLECYAAGLPVVATAAGGIPYIAEHERTALLVPLDDHEALAAAALRLLEEEGLAVRLARAGRAELTKYTWKGGVRDAWMRAYAELAGRPDIVRPTPGDG